MLSSKKKHSMDCEAVVSKTELISIVEINPKIYDRLYTNDQIEFFFKTITLTLKALINYDYSQFDGHTTANCCHGMSTWVCFLIEQVRNIDLDLLAKKIRGFSNKTNLLLPKELILLARVFIIAVAKKIDSARGVLTDFSRVKLIYKVSTRFATELVKNIQQFESNNVASSYKKYLAQMPSSMVLHSIPVSLWGKYCVAPYVRTDMHGTSYVASMFSMRVVLANLIHNKSIIVVVHDLFDYSYQFQCRNVSFFKGNGIDNFTYLSEDEVLNLQKMPDKPVIVFHGKAFSDALEENQFKKYLDPWINKILDLFLACDIDYPHFPKVRNDISFNYKPIKPDEDIFNAVIDQSANIKGVSLEDSSLYLLAHIYPASIKQVLDVYRQKSINLLPFFSS